MMDISVIIVNYHSAKMVMESGRGDIAAISSHACANLYSLDTQTLEFGKCLVKRHICKKIS